MNLDYSSNRINVSNQPIKSIDVKHSTLGEKKFDKAIDYLYPGDIFVLSNTERSYFSDGLYVVREKDNTNKGLILSEIRKDIKSIHNTNTLATADSTNGDVQVIGHLSVNA